MKEPSDEARVHLARASVFQEELDGITGDTPEDHIRRRTLRLSISKELIKAAQFEPAPEPSRPDSGSRYEVVNWDTMETAPFENGDILTEEEIKEWVDEQLVADPLLADRLDITDEMPIHTKALKLYMHFRSQEETTD
jgi:hypothetical protein